MIIHKPMLASTCKDIKALMYPVMASPKLDGIRCVTPGGMPLSRSLKAIKNDYIRQTLTGMMANRYDRHPFMLDGELVTLNEDGTLRTFNEIQGDIMRRAGEPKWEYLVFDCLMHDSAWQTTSYPVRYKWTNIVVRDVACDSIKLVPHITVSSAAELAEFEEYCVGKGYEGIMTRSISGLYKQGRSTPKQQWLTKVKRFSDAEGVVVRLTELMINQNERKLNELGQMARTQGKAAMVAADTMGAMIVDTKEWGKVTIGSGFSADMRKDIWIHPEYYIGKTITFKYQASGMKDMPRFPTFKGFRDGDDL